MVAERTEEHIAVGNSVVEDSLEVDSPVVEGNLEEDIQVEGKHLFHKSPAPDNLAEEERRRAVAVGCSNSLWREPGF